MAVEAEVLMAAEAAASMGTAARIAVAVENLVKAAGDLTKVASDLMAEEVTAEAAHLGLAAVWAHPRRDRRLAARRIFVPPSTMASGIRSAAAPVPLEASVPLDRRVRAKGAIPPAPGTPPSWLATAERPMPVGALLADREARPASWAEPVQPSAALAALALEAASVAGAVVE